MTAAGDEISGAYWEGARRGVFVVQRCGRCGIVRHYPRPLCDACYSWEWAGIEADPHGTIYSWTVTHHAFVANPPAELPYVLATVEMSVGVRVLGILEGIEPGLGLPVRLVFRQGDPPIPTFVSAEGKKFAGMA